MSKKGKFILLDIKCKRLTVSEINKDKKVPEYITTNDWYYAEKFCYEWLKGLSKIQKIKTDCNITEKILDKNKTLNVKQKEIVEHIMDKNLNIIIGKAGTGKSYITKQILNMNMYNGEWIEIVDVEYGETEEDNSYLVKRYGTETNKDNIIHYSYEEISTEVMLAYAVTVHKCQGSTINNVIFVTIPEHQYMLTRELVYTGMSRTADNLVIIGEEQALEKSSFRKVSDKRKTFLGLINDM